MHSRLQTLFREKMVKIRKFRKRDLLSEPRPGGTREAPYLIGPLTPPLATLPGKTYFGLVMAPSDAEWTRAPYLAKTPVVKRGLGAFH